MVTANTKFSNKVINLARQEDHHNTKTNRNWLIASDQNEIQWKHFTHTAQVNTVLLARADGLVRKW